MRTSVEHLVIGGGPAGSMLAFRLAAAGLDVMLLEKEREPHHKVCGEFLSPEAVEYLRSVEIEPRELGARSIQRVRLHSGRRSIESRLPFTALSLSRRILDETLMQRAASVGSTVWRDARVEKLHPHGSHWRAQFTGGRSLEVKTVFLATGKHDLHDWPRSSGSQSDLVGFKMHWKLDAAQTEALRDYMELFLFREGYGGLSLVENNTANLCFVVRRRKLRQLGGWSELLNAIRSDVPAIDQRLRSGMPCWTRPLAISPIPYGHLGAPTDGIWRVGDQAAVIPSFTGDGMSIALHSGALAAEMYLQGKSPDAYLRCLATQLRPGMRFASALSRAMVKASGRLIAPAALAMLPGAIGRIAKITRIPDDALRQLRASVAPVRPSTASLA
jgi:menaquinone-9 beta-reductase